ncbi:hypothetical protein AVEN_111107-1 [Araneus ventricosus]|uniref:Tc1-like transposase DDE domain-containing protein n=1 Tax=Araneus ventricosus TaxID=182803 RepID=A0A4Y2DMD5_ARAVE|nr:hypothetical protein AVEN_111107-1 [Araneus ventricosus]
MWIGQRLTTLSSFSIHDIILPHVHNFCGTIGNCLIVVDNNARCHSVALVHNFLKVKGYIEWSGLLTYPSLIPTEHVWNAFERRVAERNSQTA